MHSDCVNTLQLAPVQMKDSYDTLVFSPFLGPQA